MTLRQKWLTALRSGQYKQQKGIMRSLSSDGVESFCAIGLLLGIAGIEWREIAPNTNSFVNVGGRPEWLKIIQGTGIESISGQILMLNDLQGKNFIEIADWIEANAPKEIL